MKKCLNFSIFYAILGLAGGVFYREFTKFNEFSGATALGKVHTHLLLLGMFLFLILSLFAARFDVEKLKSWRVFLWMYNIGLIVSAVMMCTRGIVQVKEIVLSRAADASIAGIAGIGHALVGIGLLILLFGLKKLAGQKQ